MQEFGTMEFIIFKEISYIFRRLISNSGKVRLMADSPISKEQSTERE